MAGFVRVADQRREISDRSELALDRLALAVDSLFLHLQGCEPAGFSSAVGDELRAGLLLDGSAADKALATVRM